ncbi:carbohydrate ABC transporter substrate-binding protein, CUT1 family [Micromonospora rhizosphaerae]|uniref:Carbohydrate ABC transporter substrate-binding protein, CUT1 family n=1 Tax=Micromonospora rhizosphaerae TaxID=568872 RepID=A0A1C6SYZ1_9ACTN|nr:extracellular solute-binding protein [Micromonospora rhizosphaerae]SCL34794.1 carbohydrate ABC transporter substrate-binding protein, CUT1 family [Micromonospora rhizosphaerae]
MSRAPGRPRTRAGLRAAVGLVTALGLFGAAACAPGSSPSKPAGDDANRTVQTDAAKLGNVTLTVWDQEVRGGQNEQMTALNEAFHAKYPNITIKRVSRSFDDLGTTLRLALSGNDAPDVVQSNNGRADMGKFVQAQQLLSLEPWAKAYGWADRYPDSVLQYSRYTPDGKTFGEGNIYGMPQVGEIVGIFYNKEKLTKLGLQPPKTWADLTSALATAKQHGEAPLQLGNLDKWPAVHVFGTIQGQFVPADQVTKLGFGGSGASWNTPENTKAAEELVNWVNAGYFNNSPNGTDYDKAWQNFAAGQGMFLIAGSWLGADLDKSMGDKVGFSAPPPGQDGKVAATGGTGLPFTITSKAKNPDAAAAYINFITSSEAMTKLAKTGNMPVVETAKQQKPSGVQGDIFDAFGATTESGRLLPYLDYATPTMADTLGAALQDLIAKRISPQQFLQKLQDDNAKFVASNG